MDKQQVSAYRKRLLDGGIAPAAVRRNIRELLDHQRELKQQAMARGLGEPAAEEEAQRQLGDPEQLAAAMLERRELRSRVRRFPATTLVVLPPLAFAVLYAALIFAMIVGGLGVEVFGASAMTDSVPPSLRSTPAWVATAFDMLRFAMNYVVTPLFLFVLALLGIRHHASSRYWLTGILLLCVLSSATNLHVQLPVPERDIEGSVGIGLTLAVGDIESLNPFATRNHNFRLLLNLLLGGVFVWYGVRRENAEAVESY